MAMYRLLGKGKREIKAPPGEIIVNGDIRQQASLVLKLQPLTSVWGGLLPRITPETCERLQMSALNTVRTEAFTNFEVRYPLCRVGSNRYALGHNPIFKNCAPQMLFKRGGILLSSNENRCPYAIKEVQRQLCEQNPAVVILSDWTFAAAARCNLAGFWQPVPASGRPPRHPTPVFV